MQGSLFTLFYDIKARLHDFEDDEVDGDQASSVQEELNIKGSEVEA